MRSMNALLLFVVAAGAATPVFSEDNGFQFEVEETCFTLPVLNTEACVSLSLNSCENSVAASFTYDDNVIFDGEFTQDDIENEEFCTDAVQGCSEICLTLNDVEFTPAGVSVQPVVSYTCGGGFIKGDVDGIDQIQIGSSCVASSCSDCNAITNCGWCATNAQCQPEGVEGPYCSECAADDWQTSLSSCPGADESSGDDNTRNMVLYITIPIAVLALLGLVIFCVRRKRPMRGSSGYSQDTEMDDELFSVNSSSGETMGETAYEPPTTA